MVCQANEGRDVVLERLSAGSLRPDQLKHDQDLRPKPAAGDLG